MVVRANSNLNSIRAARDVSSENSVNLLDEIAPTKTLCSPFSIDRHFRRLMLYPPELRARYFDGNSGRREVVKHARPDGRGVSDFGFV
jgi:hypothetical protein